MDITKCTNSNCQIKETCTRYTCSASLYQSYQMFESIGNRCDYKLPFNFSNLTLHTQAHKIMKLGEYLEEIYVKERLKTYQEKGSLLKVFGVPEAVFNALFSDYDVNEQSNKIKATREANNTKNKPSIRPVRPVINKVTKEQFRTIKLAADSIGIGRMSLSQKLNGKKKNKTDMEFLDKYLKENKK